MIDGQISLNSLITNGYDEYYYNCKCINGYYQTTSAVVNCVLACPMNAVPDINGLCECLGYSVMVSNYNTLSFTCNCPANSYFNNEGVCQCNNMYYA